MDAELTIKTFAGGALSKLGHDLVFALPSTLTFHGNGLEVECQLKDIRLLGRATLGAGVESVSERDARRILSAVHSDVLQTERYPTARVAGEVQGSAARRRLIGTLTLLGRTRPVEIALPTKDGHLDLRWECRPSIWEIPPYSALLGALRVEDRVLIEWSGPMTAS